MKILRFFILLSCLFSAATVSASDDADTIKYEKWMSQLPDSMRLSMMSIPCAHDAATHAAVLPWIADQKYDEKTLFEKGVRAFDLRINWWPGGYTLGPYMPDIDVILDYLNQNEITDRSMIHGDPISNVALNNYVCALNSFKEEMTHMPEDLGNECMILFVQTDGKWYTNIDKGPTFKYFLNYLVEKYGAKNFIEWKPDLTLKEARGKIILVTTDAECTGIYNNAGDKIPVARKDTGISKEEKNKQGVDGIVYSLSDPTKYSYFINESDYDESNSAKKFQKVKTKMEQYFEKSNGGNPHNVLNYGGLNGYWKVLGGANVACDFNILFYNWKGVNHLTYDYFKTVSRPLGVIPYDWCGEDYTSSYGGPLLREIVRHNFIPQGYISELAVGAGKTESSAKKALEEKGYKVIPGDLKKGAGNGWYLYLGAKYTSDPYDAITDITVVKSNTDDRSYLFSNDSIKMNEIGSYCRIKAFSNEDTGFTGDLMKGTGKSTDLHIYYHKDRYNDTEPIHTTLLKSITVNYDISTDDNKNYVTISNYNKADNTLEYTKDAAELNKDVALLTFIRLNHDSHKHSESGVSWGYNNDNHYHVCAECFHSLGDYTPHTIKYVNPYSGVHIYDCTDECGYAYLENCTADSYDENGIGTCTICNGVTYEPAVLVDTVYEISNAGQLKWFAEQATYVNPKMNGRLTKDISLECFPSWMPMCTVNDSTRAKIEEFEKLKNVDLSYVGCGYQGVFDGQCHVIKDVHLKDTEGFGYLGLFGATCFATVKNLAIINSDATVDDSFVGILAGIGAASKFENIYVANSSVNSNTMTFSGGLMGSNMRDTLQNVIFDGTLLGDVVYPVGNNIENCVFKNVFVKENKYRRAYLSGAVARPVEDFTSGKICYELNDSTYSNKSIWHQNLGDDDDVADSIPCFEADHHIPIPAKFNGKDFIGVVPEGDNYKRLTLNLKDGKDFYVPEPIMVTDAKKISEQRNVSSYSWGTVCLPYEISSDEDVQLYTLSNMLINNGIGTTYFDPVDRVPANTPALFRKLTQVETINFNPASASDAITVQCREPRGHYIDGSSNIFSHMYGTFERDTIYQADGITEQKFYLKNNNFYSVNQYMYAAPFRAWLDLHLTGSTSYPSTWDISINPATGINDDDLILDASEIESPVYDTTGRRVDIPVNGQIVIRHGKKQIYNKK